MMANININDLLNDFQEYDDPDYVARGRYEVIDYIKYYNTLIIEIYDNDFLSNLILDLMNDIDYMRCSTFKNGITKSYRYTQYEYRYGDKYDIYLRIYHSK